MTIAKAWNDEDQELINFLVEAKQIFDEPEHPEWTESEKLSHAAMGNILGAVLKMEGPVGFEARKATIEGVIRGVVKRELSGE